jgi:hypothetical protein
MVGNYKSAVPLVENSTQQSALGIQPAQRLREVSTGILSSKVAVMETKTLNHRTPRSSAETFFCRRFALKSSWQLAKTKNEDEAMNPEVGRENQKRKPKP